MLAHLNGKIDPTGARQEAPQPGAGQKLRLIDPPPTLDNRGLIWPRNFVADVRVFDGNELRSFLRARCRPEGEEHETGEE